MNSSNPSKIFVILSVATIAVVFAAGVIAATVSPTAAEHPRVQQTS